MHYVYLFGGGYFKEPTVVCCMHAEFANVVNKGKFKRNVVTIWISMSALRPTRQPPVHSLSLSGFVWCTFFSRTHSDKRKEKTQNRNWRKLLHWNANIYHWLLFFSLRMCACRLCLAFGFKVLWLHHAAKFHFISPAFSLLNCVYQIPL